MQTCISTTFVLRKNCFWGRGTWDLRLIKKQHSNKMKCFGFNCASSLIASPYFLIVIFENITWNELIRKKWGLLSSPKSRELFGDKCSKTGTRTSLLQNKWTSQSLTDNDHWNICMLTDRCDENLVPAHFPNKKHSNSRKDETIARTSDGIIYTPMKETSYCPCYMPCPFSCPSDHHF